MRNHELIALGSAEDYWNYHLDQNSMMMGERQLTCAGLAVASEATNYYKALKSLEHQVKRPPYLINQLKEYSDDIIAVTDLEGLGEVVWLVWDNLGVEIDLEIRDELLKIAGRLIQIGGEIEESQRDSIDGDDYEETQDD